MRNVNSAISENNSELRDVIMELWKKKTSKFFSKYELLIKQAITFLIWGENKQTNK